MQLLTEEELTQLDDLYQLLVPTRICNAEYVLEHGIQKGFYSPLTLFFFSPSLPAQLSARS